MLRYPTVAVVASALDTEEVLRFQVASMLAFRERRHREGMRGRIANASTLLLAIPQRSIADVRRPGHTSEPAY